LFSFTRFCGKRRERNALSMFAEGGREGRRKGGEVTDEREKGGGGDRN
jgi:hypothetical protein